MITVVWSAKEAALKALRHGLRDDPRDVAITLLDLGAAGWHRLAIRAPNAPALAGWWCTDAGFVVAIVGTELEQPPVLIW
jgi:4'-phosphopantetheinyl transferase